MVRIARILSTFFVLLFLVATIVPVGTAQAYISPSDYCAQWSQYGIAYPWGSQGTTPTGSYTPPPANTGGSAGTGTVTKPYYTGASDYYSKLAQYRSYYTPKPAPVHAPTPAPSPAPSGTGDIDYLSAGERQMFDLVNQERVKAGLRAFAVDSGLVNLARLKSQDMYENNYFSHTSPTYGTPLQMERNAGISARVMGAENIAKAGSVARAHELLMNSEGHRANLLDPRHDTIGIGVVGTPYGVYVTQLFLGH